MSVVQVDSNKELQLVAAAALLITTKYEEIYPPSGREILHVLCKPSSKDENVYKHKDLLKLESEMLTKIEFQICETSPLNFLYRYFIVAKSNEQTKYAAQYFLEAALLDSKMNQYSSSILAASSLYAAMRSIVYDSMHNS
jgi:hypothetical protein